MTQHPTEAGKGAQEGSEAAGIDILTRVDRMLDGVTEGPWEQNGNNGIHTPQGRCVALTHSSDWNGQGANKRDALFIAAARTLVPELRDEVQRLKTELAGAQQTIAHQCEGMGWIAGHDRQGLDHLNEAMQSAKERDAARAEVERLKGALESLVAECRTDPEFQMSVDDCADKIEAVLRVSCCTQTPAPHRRDRFSWTRTTPNQPTGGH